MLTRLALLSSVSFMLLALPISIEHAHAQAVTAFGTRTGEPDNDLQNLDAPKKRKGNTVLGEQDMRGAIDLPVPNTPNQTGATTSTAPAIGRVSNKDAVQRSTRALRNALRRPANPAATGASGKIPTQNNTKPTKALGDEVRPVFQSPHRYDINNAGIGLDQPPAQRKKAVQPETDPYMPIGVKVGTFTVTSGIDVSGGYDSNPKRERFAKGGSPLLKVAPDLKLQSDWSRHALTIDLKGAYTNYFTQPDANKPEFDAKISGKIELGDNTKLDLEFRDVVDSQKANSANLPSSVVGRPIFITNGLTATLTQKFGAASLALRGSIDHVDYLPAKLAGGGTMDQSDRNLTAYGLRLRGSYEVTPGIIPFVEIGVDTRRYDQKVSDSGYQRSSDGIGARIGSTFELSRTLVGEISGGYGFRSYDDYRLRDLQGYIIDANLIWSISPLTTLTLKAGTDFAETTISNASGSITERGSIALKHDILRNVTIGGTLGYAVTTFIGNNRIERALTAGTTLDYKIGRNIVWRSSYALEQTRVNKIGQSYLAHIMLSGIRFQY